MKKSILTLALFLLSILISESVHAQDLLGESCVSLVDSAASSSVQRSWSGDERNFVMMNAGVGVNGLGLSCKNLKAIDDSYYLVSLAIMPALKAFSQSAAVRAGLAAELAGMGIVAGSPAVLGVTVIGGFGIVTIKLLLKASLEECARQDREALKQEILRELDARYGARGTAETTLQIGG